MGQSGRLGSDRQKHSCAAQDVQGKPTVAWVEQWLHAAEHCMPCCGAGNAANPVGAAGTAEHSNTDKLLRTTSMPAEAAHLHFGQCREHGGGHALQHGTLGGVVRRCQLSLVRLQGKGADRTGQAGDCVMNTPFAQLILLPIGAPPSHTAPPATHSSPHRQLRRHAGRLRQLLLHLRIQRLAAARLHQPRHIRLHTCDGRAGLADDAG